MTILRIACITDLHGRLGALARILAHAGPADAVLLGGDITNFGSPIDVERVVRAAREHSPIVLAVAGNCDSAAIDQRLVELGAALHGRGIVLGGVGFHGLSGTPPWKRGMYEMSEDDLDTALRAGHEQVRDRAVRVLLAHVPPRKTRLDRTRIFLHAGSSALRRFVEESQPALVFCGHIHEGRGIERIGASTVVNCGHGAVGAYAWAEIGEQIKVELRSA